MKERYSSLLILLGVLMASYGVGVVLSSAFDTPDAGFPDGLAGLCIYNTVDKKWVAVEGDEEVGAIMTITLPHAMIHLGKTYTASFSNETTNTGEMTVIAFNSTTLGDSVHMSAVYSSSAGARFGIYPAPSIDVDEGTDLTLYNTNGNSDNTSAVTSIENPAVAGGVTSYNETQAADANITKTIEIYPYELAAGQGPFAIGGAADTRVEYIVEKGTQVAIILTATTDNTDVHNLVLSFYEH